MISVSSDYKTAAKALTKQIRAYVVDQEVYPTEITGDDDLVYTNIKTDTSLLHAVMRQAEVRHLGTHNFLDKLVNIGFGHVLADGTTVEYIDYGSFKVVKRETEKSNDIVTLKLFDKMYESLIAWDLDPIYDITYPCTVLQLLEAICDRFSWTLATTTFPNSTQTIEEDNFTTVVQNYRQVLDMIAEIAGGIIMFDVNDELIVKNVEHSTTVETLNSTVLESLSVETKFGPINSVVLSRQPQEDNIVDKDQSSIDANGLTEMKINDNIIADPDRETYVEEILDELLGLEFYPFETTTNGLGYLQPGDRIIVQDRTGASFPVVIFGIDITITAGARETLSALRPDKTSTNYNTAGIIGQTIKNTQIIVDKQEGKITLLVEDMTDTQTNISILEQLADQLNISIQGLGGTNLLKNSVGLKGDIAEWQELDSNGDLIDADNDGTILTTTDVRENTDSGSGIFLYDGQYISQTLPTIIGESYTFYCRFKKNGIATVNITGVGDVDLDIDSYVTDSWAVFKTSFEAASSATILTITTGAGDELTVSDNVLKIGDVNGWVQAPNEVYGSNYRFDKDGFEITSLTSTLKSVLDNQSLAVYDTASGDRILMIVSKDSAKLTRLVAQEDLTIQRYENPSSSLRFIPTDTGAMIVIND